MYFKASGNLVDGKTAKEKEKIIGPQYVSDNYKKKNKTDFRA